MGSNSKEKPLLLAGVPSLFDRLTFVEYTEYVYLEWCVFVHLSDQILCF